MCKNFPVVSTAHRLFLIEIKWVMLFILLDVPPHGVSLLGYSRNHLIVDVSEQQLGVRFQTFLCFFEGLHDEFSWLLPPGPLLVLAPPASGGHVVSQARDGVVLLVPVVHLVDWTVRRAVVTGAVMTDPGGGRGNKGFVYFTGCMEISNMVNVWPKGEISRNRHSGWQNISCITF